MKFKFLKLKRDQKLHMKLWDKGISIDKRIEKFTVGNDRELDMFMAKYDIIASKAHAKMLKKLEFLTTDEVDNRCRIR